MELVLQEPLVHSVVFPPSFYSFFFFFFSIPFLVTLYLFFLVHFFDCLIHAAQTGLIRGQKDPPYYISVEHFRILRLRFATNICTSDYIFYCSTSGDIKQFF